MNIIAHVYSKHCFICLYVLIILLNSFSIHGQIVYEVKDPNYQRIADSLLSNHISNVLNECVKYTGTLEKYISSKKNSFSSNSDLTKAVCVNYFFVDKCNKSYSFQIKGFRRRVFEFIFDFKYNIIKEPDYKLIQEISVAHNYCYLSYDSAEVIARENLNAKSRKTWQNVLVYDLNIDKVYWLISREHGFGNGVIETIKIDAIDGHIIAKTNLTYKRNFFKALYVAMYYFVFKTVNLFALYMR